jgi:hypothetical protein
MRTRRYWSLLGCVALLVAVTAPMADAAPAAQWPTPVSYDAPEATMLRTVREVVPAEVLQQTAVQIVPLDGDTYLVSHPSLVWPMGQADNARLVVDQYFARHGRGWGTLAVNGPQGQGVYLTYDVAVIGSPQAGLLPTVQQLLPRETLQQTPLQLQPLDADTYLLDHPGLFWPVDQAGSAQAAALHLASRIPNVHTMVLNGPRGFGVYLTFDTVGQSAAQAGLLPTVQGVLPPEALQQTPLQLQYLDGSRYLVAHPGLFWPVEQAVVAQAVVQQLASQTPGWGAEVANGPLGFGVYATFEPTAAAAQEGVLLAIHQVLPPMVLQQAPVQLQYLDSSTYLVAHPNLFWPVEQAALAHGVVQQLTSRTRGWGAIVANGSQGYGIYLTYRAAV